MSEILPALSIEEQTARYNRIKRDTPFPATFKFDYLINLAQFPNSGPSFYGNFLVRSFAAPNALAIVGVDVSLQVPLAGPSASFTFMLSFLNFNSISGIGAPTDNPGIPDDSGNIIYYSAWNGPLLILDNRWYHESPYFMSAGQSLYLQLSADNATVTAASSTVLGAIVFHTLQTGRKN